MLRITSFAAFIATLLVVHVSGDDCTFSQAVDIFFVADSSTSISDDDYQKQLEFFAELVKQFYDIGARFSLTLFSDELKVVVNIGQYASKTALLDTVLNVKRIYGNTHTGEALASMRKEVTSSRSGSHADTPKIAIVVTDGASQDNVTTAEEARKVHADRIVVYAIRVGKILEKDRIRVMMELHAIATDPDSEHLFTVDNYDALDSIRKSLGASVCKTAAAAAPPPPEPKLACYQKGTADVTFIIDESVLSSHQSWYVSAFFHKFATRVALGPSDLSIHLVREDCTRRNVFINSVYEINRFFAYTNTEHFLSNVLTHLGPVAHRSQMAVLFIDDSVPITREIITSSVNAMNNNYELFVVSVGQRQVSDLYHMASPHYDQHIIMVDSYDKLENSLDLFLRYLCPT